MFTAYGLREPYMLQQFYGHFYEFLFFEYEMIHARLYQVDLLWMGIKITLALLYFYEVFELSRIIELESHNMYYLDLMHHCGKNHNHISYGS